MKNADKNRDPERARARAKSDARCALRKLGLMGELARLAADLPELQEHEHDDPARTRAHDELLEAWRADAGDLVGSLIGALEITEGDR